MERDAAKGVLNRSCEGVKRAGRAVWETLALVQERFRMMAESEALTNFVLVMITINTLLMAIDHDCEV